MIKQFSAGDITTRPFITFKKWEIQNMNSASVNMFGESTYYTASVEVNEGILLSSSFDSTTDPINQSGKFKRVVYQSTNEMFYKNSGNPVETFGVETLGVDLISGHKENRNINDRIVTAKIRKNLWGEKIKPGSFRLTDHSDVNQIYNVYDDGSTNLYITGSQFSNRQFIGAPYISSSAAYWNSSSGHFSYGTESFTLLEARSRLSVGLPVDYIEDADSILFDSSTSRDIFESHNERFGECVDIWGRYLIVGSPMDSMSLSNDHVGYASLFKFDTSKKIHRHIKTFFSPFTVEGLTQEYGVDSLPIVEPLFPVQSSSKIDEFGSAVSVKDGFLAIGAPSASICSDGNVGFVYVYDRKKGGIDNWGMINVLQGENDGDLFGAAVSIDSDIMAIGSPGANGNTGLVHIFRRKRYMSGDCSNLQTSSFWQRVSDETGFCTVLESDSISGSYIYSEQGTPTFVSGNYSWEFETTLSSSVASPGDNFGWCLEASSNRLIVGVNVTGSKDGYATLFQCTYTSASINDCPTASWTEFYIYHSDDSNGDLGYSPIYSTTVQLDRDGYGRSVALSGNNLAIGSLYDKAFIPYPSSSATPTVLGAVYFYKLQQVTDCGTLDFNPITKTFGDRSSNSAVDFGRSVSIDGIRAAVGSTPVQTSHSVQFINNQFILEGIASQSNDYDELVLGKATIYQYDNINNVWSRGSDVRLTKETNSPLNASGRSLAISSNFLAFGAPIYNVADPVSSSLILDPTVQTTYNFPSSYSGSVVVYNFDDYTRNPQIGNVFYKNGYIVITNTSSLYQKIMTNSGSRGYNMTYQGTHTIYEHEYLVSVSPGEFNYSTNPTALISDPLKFDVNQDGAFNFSDVDLIMKYLTNSRFSDQDSADDDGIILEDDSLNDYSWWGNDLILTEAEDVLLLESEYQSFASSSIITAYTKAAYDYITVNLVETGLLDIDGDGTIDLNDGALLVAYFSGKLTTAVVERYTNSKSTRRYPKDINDYLDRYCGKKMFDVNPNFLGYLISSSFDLTGSYLAPTITSIGLYDSGSLVAVAKLGKPIKNLIDWPINFIVRFDT